MEALPLGWEVDVSLKFFELDQNHDKYLTVQDVNEKPRRYHTMKTEWSYSQLLPFSVFNDPTKGYLVGDKCIFGAEVFVITYSGAGELLPQPKNLSKSSSTNSVPAEVRALSQRYHVDEHKDLAIGIRLDDTTPTVYATYKLMIKNQAKGEDAMVTGYVY